MHTHRWVLHRQNNNKDFLNKNFILNVQKVCFGAVPVWTFFLLLILTTDNNNNNIFLLDNEDDDEMKKNQAKFKPIKSI